MLEYLKRIGLKNGWLVIYSDAVKDFEYITEEENGIKLHHISNELAGSINQLEILISKFKI
ncbi:hypothetical protein [Marinitoga hydrogenitolerans]|uniref:hypothetical protein n=1 Tax=Marinitoga hydrogenitolerans TaxID=287990 RepID=UPI0009344675|nr:hypothetical protein [Marinitoga hydrogenitolerans]